MKLADLKKQAQTKPNLAAKHSQSSGAGAHKSPKDYERKEKHPKDLRRTDESRAENFLDKIIKDRENWMVTPHEGGFEIQTSDADFENFDSVNVGYGDKRTLMKVLLHLVKEPEDDGHRVARNIIRHARKAGHYYPEFEAIEKSIGSQS